MQHNNPSFDSDLKTVTAAPRNSHDLGKVAASAGPASPQHRTHRGMSSAAMGYQPEPSRPSRAKCIGG